MVLITGAGGILGSAVTATAPAGQDFIGARRADGDLTDGRAVRALLAAHAPDVVIHCAAYTDVDGCTQDPQRARRNNADATALIAQECAQRRTRLIFVSTDYVFSGTKTEPYGVDDQPQPLNPYGESKLAGERAVAEALDDYLIVRTQWLYGPGGNNFVSAILNRAQAGESLKVAADEFGSPTYSRDLAQALWLAATSELRGIVHITNSGHCSRLALAEAALEAAGLGHTEIDPIKAADWPSPTARPLHVVLDNRRWLQAGYPRLRPWPQAVQEYVARYFSR